MRSSGVHHVDLVVSSIERSLPFYRELLGPLGYHRISEVEGERGETIWYLSGPGVSIGLREAAEQRASDRPLRVGLHHLAFEAVSRAVVDERARWLVERGRRDRERPRGVRVPAGLLRGVLLRPGRDQAGDRPRPRPGGVGLLVADGRQRPRPHSSDGTAHQSVRLAQKLETAASRRTRSTASPSSRDRPALGCSVRQITHATSTLGTATSDGVERRIACRNPVEIRGEGKASNDAASSGEAGARPAGLLTRSGRLEAQLPTGSAPRDPRRIVAREAGAADRRLGQPRGGLHPLEREVVERGGADQLAHLLHRRCAAASCSSSAMSIP